VTHCTFSLDSENALLLKHNINLWMPFPHSFLLDIVLTNRQNMLMDAWGCIMVSSTDSTMTKYRTDFAVLELASRHLRSIIWLVFLDCRFFGTIRKFNWLWDFNNLNWLKNSISGVELKNLIFHSNSWISVLGHKSKILVGHRFLVPCIVWILIPMFSFGILVSACAF
jgi:hypothetical protein